MTDEKLDEARANEATRRAGMAHKMGPANVAWIAAKLAREGWKPEDPLLKEAREIVAQDLERTGYEQAARMTREEEFNDHMTVVRIALTALRRGIKIGRQQKLDELLAEGGE